MESELFEKALLSFEINPAENRRELSSETNRFLEEQKVKDEVKNFLASASYVGDIKIGNVCFSRVNSISRDNLLEENRRCIENGLLIVGNGLNGDPIAIDLNTLEVGFIFHDELWESQKYNPRDIFVSMRCSIGKLFLSAADPKYPVDAYEAEEYWSRKEL